MSKTENLFFAHKALNLMEHLSAADRRVAGCILGHYNSKTGQCDPGNARLARLLKMDERTVRRATRDLCETHGLFSKVSHGGKSHRAFYTPDWSAFNKVIAEFDAAMKRKDDPPSGDDNRAKSPGSVGRNCPVEQGETALQTLRRNSDNKLIAPYGASGDAGSAVDPCGDTQPPESQPRGCNGLLSGREKAGTQAEKRKPQVVFSVSRSVASEAEAEKRWDADLRTLGLSAYSDAVQHITEPIMLAATAAEMKRRGGGLRLIAQELGPEILRATIGHGKEN